MGWNAWVRQIHRWLSILFTAIVASIFAAQGFGEHLAGWTYFTPLFPLAFLLLTGLYLFVLPYVSGSRRRQG